MAAVDFAHILSASFVSHLQTNCINVGDICLEYLKAYKSLGYLFHISFL